MKGPDFNGQVPRLIKEIEDRQAIQRGRCASEPLRRRIEAARARPRETTEPADIRTFTQEQWFEYVKGLFRPED